jgi:anti-sigma regulatory factor (Ser/Thr protein kinase)
MKLKRIALFFVLLASLTFTYAQQTQFYFHTEPDYLKAKPGGGIAYYDDGRMAYYGSKSNFLFSLGVSSIDGNANQSYPLNQINSSTYFNHFTNPSSVQVSFSVHSSIAISNMLYSIVDDKDSIQQWKKLDGRFVRQNESDGDYRTNILLNVPCRNKVITIRLYNITNPEVILTQIVSTVPMQQPILLVNLRGYPFIDSVDVNGFGVAKERPEQKDLQTAHLTTADMQLFESGDLFLNTNNSPYVYSLSLIRHRKARTDTVTFSVTWTELDSNISKPTSFDFKNKALYNKTYTAHIPVNVMAEPGTYELLLIPGFNSALGPGAAVYTNKLVSMKFVVHPSNTIDVFYVILYAALFLLTALLFFIWYKRKQKRRMQQQQQLAKEARLKLEAVRSQLNPHFVFNALAGIQNLMNKHELDKAHNYLTSFSRITRSVLDNSAKELITVDEEIKWLKDYLEMEQLRFGFQYEISVDKELDKHNVEIPVMLLQPFVENAVKHGISSLKENGRVAIRFHKLDSHLQVSISDNGKGFDAMKEYNGAGLALSKSRVDLLNTIYKNTPAQLTIDSTANGTNVVITLNNWL